jgi:hypothetical protein
LLLITVQQAIQQRAGVGGVEEVTFTQLTAAENRYRDAVRFPNGVEILLQDFAEGQRVRVLDLSSAEPRHPEIAEESSFTLVRWIAMYLLRIYDLQNVPIERATQKRV